MISLYITEHSHIPWWLNVTLSFYYIFECKIKEVISNLTPPPALLPWPASPNTTAYIISNKKKSPTPPPLDMEMDLK